MVIDGEVSSREDVVNLVFSIQYTNLHYVQNYIINITPFVVQNDNKRSSSMSKFYVLRVRMHFCRTKLHYVYYKDIIFK
jgi:hypothetical protein